MARLLIVWHSRTGGAEQVAHAAAAGAGSNAVIKAAAEAGPPEMLAADGYLFACPENLAAMTGAMKEFFDRTYYPLLGRIEGRAYATMIAAGSDGAGAARQIARIATGWRLRAIAEPLIVCTGAQTPEAILAAKTITDADLARCRDLGAAIAAGLSMGIF